MPNFRRLFVITIALSVVVVVILHGNPRKLRFFDPDHRHCGNSKIAHQWAIHAVYGARVSETDYYNRLTVSTEDELPRDKAELHKLLQTLAHVAQKTGRAVRINQRRMPGYDSEYLQPYSLINAPALHEYGVEVVEMGYWNRAVSVTYQNLRIGNRFVAKKIDLHDVDPISVLTQLQNDENVHEYLFSVNELLAIPQDALLSLTGEGLGFDVQKQVWKQTLACGHEEIVDKAPIPLLNDPLLP
mmetsp:Transcript_19178/g.31833  ORF Transcript_19178/g.31833 Transcript_19178/m.31833 type:complete len:243 (+) Transcript_19178:56-784(+)|eukprot:CAMPEP_0119004124 /NCGR_PEP_ID=MMETSP1176-20130426/965_1 /TAXON_ID=265551 /ORGANISM="Synedropsis recta cf, Strain CCMP1620" /LENGTH=242 /DNA_ID=CAMNT_0006955799 /DNA_START=38 /DNA_END=769 /DNA_ORIENTATION=-